jgi:hypothetical protein
LRLVLPDPYIRGFTGAWFNGAFCPTPPRRFLYSTALIDRSFRPRANPLRAGQTIPLIHSDDVVTDADRARRRGREPQDANLRRA